ELIQVAADGVAAVIDFQAVQDSQPLGDFWTFICDPRIEKVLHAGRQDLELFLTHAGQVPKPFFDTQIAAAMVGYGPQTAYANLVQRVHGIKLDKGQTYTNWSQRPLTPEQMVYALADVQFLIPVRDHLRGKLRDLGRLDWIDEEFARLEGTVGAQARDPLERYQRIRGWDSLKPRAAAVLRELASWREAEARRRNVPRGRVARDEVLLQLARQSPRNIEQLRSVRGLYGGEIDRNGGVIVELIVRASSLPPAEWPDVPRKKKVDTESTGTVELLQAVLKSVAAEADIAPTLLATTADLQTLTDLKGEREQANLPILRGWRRRLAGNLLLDVLSGKVSVSINPLTAKVALIRSLPPS
ncbi:MAG TPA: HRDC domain-containing protein, partial [Nitrospiraceae bacterium]|nr:HRDC domain-containing protein [Nitrospiraceae bacterium]